MKSVGEVMAIGRSFEEAIQKAVRMQLGLFESVAHNGIGNAGSFLRTPNPKRLFAIALSMAEGMSVEKINKITGIDPWFLYGIEKIVKAENELKRNSFLNKEKILALKQLGFSDKRIGQLASKTEF